jgi:hypothetical protein
MHRMEESLGFHSAKYKLGISKLPDCISSYCGKSNFQMNVSGSLRTVQAKCSPTIEKSQYLFQYTFMQCLSASLFLKPFRYVRQIFLQSYMTAGNNRLIILQATTPYFFQCFSRWNFHVYHWQEKTFLVDISSLFYAKTIFSPVC